MTTQKSWMSRYQFYSGWGQCVILAWAARLPSSCLPFGSGKEKLSTSSPEISSGSLNCLSSSNMTTLSANTEDRVERPPVCYGSQCRAVKKRNKQRMQVNENRYALVGDKCELGRGWDGLEVCNSPARPWHRRNKGLSCCCKAKIKNATQVNRLTYRGSHNLEHCRSTVKLVQSTVPNGEPKTVPLR